MTFGQRLKKLRREHDMTQERLADYLGVTPQAVSRWETDAVMPDITLLPAFANLFHVTTDYLLDVDISKENERIEEIKKRAWDEYNKFPHKSSHRAQQECIHNAVKVIEEGLKTYPDSWKLKEEMLLFRMCWFDDDINIVRENQREMIKICDDILENCTDTALRHKAIEHYCRLAGIFGLNDRAKELAEQMPPMSLSREMLRLKVLEGEERRQMNLWMIGKFLEEISSCIFSLTNDPAMPAEEVIELHRRSKELFAVMYGGDDCSTICNPWNSAWETAEKVANRGDLDSAFEILDREYDRMTALSEKEYKNISPYVHKDLYMAQFFKMTCEEWREEFLWRIDDDYIKFLESYYPAEFRADPRYAALLEKLRAYRVKYTR